MLQQLRKTGLLGFCVGLLLSTLVGSRTHVSLIVDQLGLDNLSELIRRLIETVLRSNRLPRPLLSRLFSLGCRITLVLCLLRKFLIHLIEFFAEILLLLHHLT